MASSVVEHRRRPSSLWSRPSQAKLFASVKGESRTRRPVDVFALGLCIFALLVVVKTSSPPLTFWQRLEELATSLPGFFNILWRTGLWVLSGWAVFLVAAPLVRTRLDILRDQVLALVCTGSPSSWLRRSSAALPDRCGTGPLPLARPQTLCPFVSGSR